MYRSKDFKEYLAEEFKSPEYAREYLLLCIEEDKMTVVEALQYTIKSMGAHEFAARIGFEQAKVRKFLTKKDGFKVSTLNEYLEFFGLEIDLCVKEVAS